MDKNFGFYLEGGDHEKSYDEAFSQAMLVREYDEERIREIATVLADDATVTRQELEIRESQRVITHILYPPVEEYRGIGGCSFGVLFLTQDREGKSYLRLEEKVWDGKVTGRWVLLERPVQAEWDNTCWITDGGSVWYAGTYNWYYDPFMKIILRGEKEDFGFEAIAGENVFRQYYNEHIQKVMTLEVDTDKS